MINTQRVNVYNEYTKCKFTVQFPYNDFEEYVDYRPDIMDYTLLI